jgi:hypothetical protein
MGPGISVNPVVKIAITIFMSLLAVFGLLLSLSPAVEKEGLFAQLVLSADGITSGPRGRQARIPWQHISHIGVYSLPSSSKNNRNTTPKGADGWLILRLYPTAPDPAVVYPKHSTSWHELNQLGYYPLLPLTSIGASHDDVTAALERFVPGRVVRTKREFLAMDHRLRADMI